MRSNKRRDLTSSQWAVLAVESEGIYEEIRRATEEERKQKISESRIGINQFEDRPENKFSGLTDSEPSDTHQTRTATKIASTFNTNQNYVNAAKRLKEQSPEQYEAIRSGEKSISEVEKERKILEKRTAIEEKQRKAEEERRAKQAETQSVTKSESGLSGNKFPDSESDDYSSRATEEEARRKMSESKMGNMNASKENNLGNNFPDLNQQESGPADTHQTRTATKLDSLGAENKFPGVTIPKRTVRQLRKPQTENK